MISKVQFRDFKMLRNVDMEIGRLNVIVGRNGVGKSTVLDGIHCLLQLASEGGRRPSADDSRSTPFRRVFSGPRAPELLASKPDATAFQVMVDESAGGQQFGIRWDTGGSQPVFHVAFPNGREWQQVGADRHYARLLESAFRAQLGSVVRLRLDPRVIAAPHSPETEIPRMEFDGEGVASVLQYLQGLRDERLESIERSLALVIPNARRIRVLQTQIRRREFLRLSIQDRESWPELEREVPANRFEVEFEGIGWVRADQLSEGTLLVLGILTAVCHRTPRLVLLDDIDRALHPIAQVEVVKLLRAMLESNDQLQIMATSHSPFVLDAIEADEAFVASALDSTSSAIRRLDSHSEWMSRSRFMQPGEFWSAVGEGWVAESR